MEAISKYELGERIRQLRDKNKLTQQDVADHLEVNRVTVTQIEAGDRVLRYDEIAILADLFKISVPQLIFDNREILSLGVNVLLNYSILTADESGVVLNAGQKGQIVKYEERFNLYHVRFEWPQVHNMTECTIILSRVFIRAENEGSI